MDKAGGPSPYLSLQQRVLALAVYITTLIVISGLLTGYWLPGVGGKTAWLSSAIGLWAFALLSTPFFVPPSQALGNSLGGLLVLLSLDLHDVALLGSELNVVRWLAAASCALAVTAGVVTIGLRNARQTGTLTQRRVERVAHRISVALGSGPLVFTWPAVISIAAFYQGEPVQMVTISALWVFLATARPVELFFRLANELAAIADRTDAPHHAGIIIRIDDPGVVRVHLESHESWTSDRVHAAHLPDGRTLELLPLFSQTQSDRIVGTGICNASNPLAARRELAAGSVAHFADLRSSADVLADLAEGLSEPELVGFVVENSSISQICFEASPNPPLTEGSLVATRSGRGFAYYQIVDAQTAEEVFSQNPRGTCIVTATQLGRWSATRGFYKHGWVPAMNTPVFKVRSEATKDAPDERHLMTLGVVPGTNIPVRADLMDLAFYHTAILGVTGTGKTEVSLDIVRKALELDFKVFCVDFTEEYWPRLSDQNPEQLSFGQAEMDELVQKIEDAEYGQYSAADERRALDEWVANARPGVAQRVAQFLGGSGPGLGVFELPEISNTRATLRATEIYLSAIFSWAKTNRAARKILVVLEEAHTVIPEQGGFRSDRVETATVISRIAQIALQGRKYGVGLLLVSQRTALVSKTLLSQCNTCISFTLYDKTGLDYLASTYTPQHVRAIPNLKFRQGVAAGKAVKSDLPVIFEAPFVAEKLAASQALGCQDAETTEQPGEPSATLVAEPGANPDGA